jgi:predicted porin
LGLFSWAPGGGSTLNARAVALAALAVAGVASAQSSVTLFGVLDAAVSGYYNKSEDILGNGYKTSRTALTNSGYNSSRLGFRGTEDLGGGLAASFWLEGAINNDDGTGRAAGGGQNWQRRSTVSLSGGFGEIRLGRDYTPTFWNDTVFDPFGTNGVGTNLISTANGFTNNGGVPTGFTSNANYVRASNSIGYFLPPNLGGFYGQVMYAFNEQTKFDPAFAPNNPPELNSSRAGRYVGGRFGYANGPLDVAAAYAQSTVGDAYFAGITTNLNTFNLGASYDFGVVKLFGEYSKAKLDTNNDGIVPIGVFNTDPSAQGWLLGATVPVGPGLIRIAYSAVKIDTNRNLPQNNGDPKADKFAIGYVHNLSKRTALYATVARISNKNGYDLAIDGSPRFVSPGVGGGSLTPKTSVGYDLGIRHAF